MDLVYLFRVLLKRKWLIIGSAFLAALVAWFLTRNEPKYYLSTSRMSTGFAVADDIRINENFSIFEADVKFNNAINTFTSPSVISLVAYKLILHDMENQSPFRRLTQDQLNSPLYKSVNKEEAKKVFQDKLESMSVLTSYKPEEKKLLEFLGLYGYGFKELGNSLNIFQVPRTDYIQIDCTTDNPELSAFIVNNLFQQFLRYYRDIRTSKSQESIDTLQSIMDKKKVELDEKNKMLRGEGLVDAASENVSKLDLIADLEKTLTFEKSKQTEDYYTMRKINQRLAALPSGENTPSTGSNNNAELIIARKEMNEAYSEYLKTNDKNALARYNRLKDEYNNKYANSSVGAADKSGDASTKAQLLERKNDLEVDIQASNAKIKSIESKISVLKSNVSSISNKGAAVEMLMEEVKVAEKEYFDAKQKYNNALDISSSSVNNFRQTQVAQPAIEPMPSKRKMVIGMAGTVAMLTCILVIVLLTYMDSSVKTPGIFAKSVNLKLISMVNFMDLKNKSLKELVAGQTEGADHAEMNRNNVFRESIRKLRYEIESSNKKIFLFTSTKKGQGKTTLIQALAYSLSLSKKKVLIIDTNFCNNDLTVQLGANPVLEKISTKDSGAMLEQIRNLSKDVSEGTVFAIGSEGGDYTPSEILPKENVLHYLQSLTEEFDYIFLEGPPLNDFSDSKELSQYVEGVIAVFSAVHIIKQIDKESIRFFSQLNGKFCGSVLNMVDLSNVNVI